MAGYLVTGNPGSGKSSVARELAARGVAAIDPDEDVELSYWVDAAGRRVDGPQQPDQEWLGSHRWVWDRARVRARLAPLHLGEDVFVCGIARNQSELIDLFDMVFLLKIDAATQEARLDEHDAVATSPRSEAGRAEIRDGRTRFEAEMMVLGATPLDGTLPTTDVTDQLLALCMSRARPA